MAVLDLNWNDIITSDQYTADLAMLTKIAVDGLGIEEYIAADNPFVFVIANLVAIQRYFIRNQVQVVDIDTTPFLNLIQQEIGFDLPLSPELPTLEWLRESKSWYGHKGAVGLMPFIGALVGSPLEIDYPAQLIARWDQSNTCLSGKVTSHGGLVPFADSKQARIRDGVRWAQFVYFVKVLQAQNLTNYTDLLNLLNNVHPAGTKRFMYYLFNYIVDEPVLTCPGFGGKFIFNPTLRLPWPTLDNGLLFDSPSSQWDQHYPGWIVEMEVLSLSPYQPGNLYRQVPYDTLTNIYIPGLPWTTVQREYWDEATQEYVQLFSDNDSLVYENVTTNMGLASYTYAQIEGLTYRQLQNIAWNNDQKNMQDQPWLHELPDLQIISS